MTMRGRNPQNDGISVLVLDDSAPLRALLAELLGEFSFVGRIVQVEDVASAQGAFEQSPFDFAILDLNIPGDEGIRNGIDLARLIKSRHPETKVALLTALADTIDRKEGIEAGADRFYDKGEFEALLNWIAEAAPRG
jgi:CheY-like chemotaxis protein